MNLNVQQLNFIWKRIQALSPPDQEYLLYQLTREIQEQVVSSNGTETASSDYPV